MFGQFFFPVNARGEGAPTAVPLYTRFPPLFELQQKVDYAAFAASESRRIHLARSKPGNGARRPEARLAPERKKNTQRELVI